MAQATAASGISAEQVRAAVEYLAGEGHLYSTIDDEHYKATSVGDIREAWFASDLVPCMLTSVWDWFLLEVVGATPPAALWVTVQEPIAPSARRRIRESAASAWTKPASQRHRTSLGG